MGNIWKGHSPNIWRSLSVRAYAATFSRASGHRFKKSLGMLCPSPIYALTTLPPNQNCLEIGTDERVQLQCSQYHEHWASLDFDIMLKLVTNRNLAWKQVSNIKRGLVAAWNQIKTDLTSTIAMNQICYCTVCICKINFILRCLHISILKTFTCTRNRNFRSWKSGRMTCRALGGRLMRDPSSNWPNESQGSWKALLTGQSDSLAPRMRKQLSFWNPTKRSNQIPNGWSDQPRKAGCWGSWEGSLAHNHPRYH